MQNFSKIGLNPVKKLRVAVIGSGNIGTDLLVKIKRSERLECTCFVGRNAESRGMSFAREFGVLTSDEGFWFLENNPEFYDLVFDATSANAHKDHAPVLKRLGKIAIDLTPAKLGELCVPAINVSELQGKSNVNMITCGGQVSAPLAHAISRAVKSIDYIEVVSTISSASAGMATRQNIDEYLETTERAILKFSGCKKAKAILNLNPAEPCVHMQTTVYAKVDDPDMDRVVFEINEMVDDIRHYVPGFHLAIEPMFQRGMVVVGARVTGAGDFLPSYAGNLDIINCAAIRVAEQFAAWMAFSNPFPREHV